MAVRRSKFSMPGPSPRGAKQYRRLVLGPFAGMVTTRPAYSLLPGETPYSENFVLEGGLLVHRPVADLPALEKLPSDYSGTVTPLVAEAVDIIGNRWDVVVTSGGSSSIATTEYTSYVGPSELPPYYNGWSSNGTTDLISGTNQLSWTQFYEPTTGQMALGVAGPGLAPAYMLLDPTQSTWTTFLDYPANSAKYIATFDDRVVLFGEREASSGNSYINRVRWSVRGAPLSMTAIGSGLEDLNEMAGTATGLFAVEDSLILLSDKEVWTGRPRRDAYAFDFDVISEQDGCSYPRTAAQTPIGVIWLGTDMVFRLATKGSVLKFQNDVSNFISERLTTLAVNDIRAQYHSQLGLYMLFYNSGTEAFFMNVAGVRQSETEPGRLKGDWLHQTFFYPSSYGHNDKLKGGNATTADIVLYLVDKNPRSFSYGVIADYGSGQPRLLWTSPAFDNGDDVYAYEAIDEVRLEYDYTAYNNPSSSTVSGIVYNRLSLDTGFATDSVSSAHLESRGFQDSAVSTELFSLQHAFFPIKPYASRHPQFAFMTSSGADSFRGKFRVHSFDVGLKRFSGRRGV